MSFGIYLADLSANLAKRNLESWLFFFFSLNSASLLGGGSVCGKYTFRLFFLLERIELDLGL